MEWLSQNWIWLVLIVGVLWLLSRSRHGSLMGGSGAHGMAREGPSGEGTVQNADAARPPIKDANAGQAAERPASSHRHGRGGCC
jgi:hypothetical protein